MNITFLEYLGYAASVIIAVSMTFNSILKFRWVNLLGAFLFTLYGFWIKAYPVGILNGLIVLVDIYYLYKIYSKTDEFICLKIDPKSEFLNTFFFFYQKEIDKI